MNSTAGWALLGKLGGNPSALVSCIGKGGLAGVALTATTDSPAAMVTDRPSNTVDNLIMATPSGVAHGSVPTVGN